MRMFAKLKEPRAEWRTSSNKGSRTKGNVFLSWSEMYQMEKEKDEVEKKYEERKQYLVSVEQRIKELERSIKEKEECFCSYELVLKEKDFQPLKEKAEREIKQVQENERIIENMKMEIAEMAERKEELLRQVEKYSVYRAFVEKVVQQSQFEDVDELVSHLENLLRTRDSLLEKRNQLEEHNDEQRNKLQTLEDQHKLLLLQKNNELSQLSSELDQERKWDHIQETAAKKTVEVGQIKMATLNLYEMTGGVVGPEGVDINDTDGQLNQINMYIKDLNDIIKQYQASLVENNPDGKNPSQTTENKEGKSEG